MMPYWTVLCGDAREQLETLDENSIQCFVTSPPYWNLRDYDLPPSIWEHPDTLGYRRDTGDMSVLCKHEWGKEQITTSGRQDVGRADAPGGLRYVSNEYAGNKKASQGQFCHHCRAWRGCLGLEPRLEMWVDHLVEIFDAAKRPLHPSGALVINLGYCYEKQTKQLIDLPADLARALKANGWVHRSKITWAKGVDWMPKEIKARERIRTALAQVRDYANGSFFGLPDDLARALNKADKAVDSLLMAGSCMPESCTDRPTSAKEEILVFSQEARYFWDQDAVRIALRTTLRPSPSSETDHQKIMGNAQTRQGKLSRYASHNDPALYNPAGRNPRNVWVMRVGTKGRGAYQLKDGRAVDHFAAYPVALVERIIKAATPEAGCCATCKAPWERVTRRTKYEPEIVPPGVRNVDASRGDKTRKLSGKEYNEQVSVETLYFAPSCRCHGSPVPARVECGKCGGTGGEQRRTLGVDQKTVQAGRHDQRNPGGGLSLAVPYATGLPCPACECPDCRGTGHQRISAERYSDHFPESGRRASGARGIIADLIHNSMIATCNFCPTCQGKGATGRVNGEVWEQATLDAWPTVPAVVGDMFAGTGTTGRAALNLGRSAVLIDLSPDYADLERERMEAWPGDVPQVASGRQFGESADVRAAAEKGARLMDQMEMETL